jgi:D-beta-D-heptose 7-phosphate kinase/D-beta-D-heptose 1-phosphate adenosyltransferase
MTGGPLVIVGDTLFDVDVVGSVRRSSPDAPSAPVLDVTNGRRRPGGAGLAAMLAVADGEPVRLVTALCDDDQGHWLADTLRERVELVAGPASGATCLKIRVLDGGRPLLRLDHGQSKAGPASQTMVDALDGAGAVLISDYGRGVAADPELLRGLEKLTSEVPVVWDPHPRGGGPIPDCAMVTPNLAEARQALHPAPLADNPLRGGLAAARLLSEHWSARAAAVTIGAQGAVLALPEQDSQLLPAEPAPPTADTCGAGDCFAATLAAALRRGDDPVTATTVAVDRASTFVKHGGAGAFQLPPQAPPRHPKPRGGHHEPAFRPADRARCPSPRR